MSRPHVLRRLALSLPVFLLLGPLAGCLVVSLQPLYDEKTVEFDETLPGVWADTDGESTLTIERGAWNAYDLTYQEGKTVTKLLGHLTRVGGQMVLDATVASGIEKPMVTVQAHWPFRLDHRGDTFSVRALDYDWFKTHLSSRQLAPLAPVFDGEQDVVLTASTPALRDWIAQHATAEGAWADPVVYKRKAGQ
jgi:hypothetical protein